MRALLAVVLVFAGIGVGWYVIANQQSEPENVPNPNGSSTPNAPNDRPKELVSDAVPPGKRPSSTNPDEGAPVPTPTTKAEPKPTPADREAEALANELGIDAQLAQKVRQWHTRARERQTQILATIADGGNALEITKEFNAAMTAERTRLLKLVPAATANRALAKLPIYKFTADGSWHRINAEGKAINFTDPVREDVWRNFQKQR